MSIFILFFRRYLFSNRSGAVVKTMARLCWLATLIGVFSLIIVSSIMNGFNRSIRTKLLSVEPHLSVMTDEATLLRIQSQIGFDKIDEMNRFAKQDVIIRTLDGRFSGGVAKGLEANGLYNFMNRLFKLKFKQGSHVEFDEEQAELGVNELMIGSDLARELNLFEGDEVVLIPPESLLGPQSEMPKFERMHIKTIFTTEFAEVDSKLLLFKLSDSPMRFQSKVSGEQGLEFRLKKPDDFENMKSYVRSLVEPGAWMTLESWADRNKALFFALRLEKVAMTTFLGLSVLITCFSLITVLVMLISQKRKEIGLLMSVGFSKKNTERLFLSIGVFLSSFGLFTGLILGVIVSILIDKYPLNILPDIYYDSSIPSELSTIFVVGVTLFCVIVAVMAAYWPVRLYMKNTPSENLRQLVAD
jgi:lipoprotein-releasing system permease protein